MEETSKFSKPKRVGIILGIVLGVIALLIILPILLVYYVFTVGGGGTSCGPGQTPPTVDNSGGSGPGVQRKTVNDKDEEGDIEAFDDDDFDF